MALATLSSLLAAVLTCLRSGVAQQARCKGYQEYMLRPLFVISVYDPACEREEQLLEKVLAEKKIRIAVTENMGQHFFFIYGPKAKEAVEAAKGVLDPGVYLSDFKLANSFGRCRS